MFPVGYETKCTGSCFLLRSICSIWMKCTHAAYCLMLFCSFVGDYDLVGGGNY
jgi:hypothetical protein